MSSRVVIAKFPHDCPMTFTKSRFGRPELCDVGSVIADSKQSRLKLVQV